MFISKWKYEMNLDNARLQGMRAGRAEATSEYHDVVANLEKENEAYQDAVQELRETVDGYREAELSLNAANAELKNKLEIAERDMASLKKLAKQQVDEVFGARRYVANTMINLVELFASKIACLQKQADLAYYQHGDQRESASRLDFALTLKGMVKELGICEDVYERAYQIYDFRNSGKRGYTLKDGKIVKVEEENQERVAETHAEEVECPFPEEETAEPAEETDAAAEEVAVCDPNQAEDSCQASGCEAE